MESNYGDFVPVANLETPDNGEQSWCMVILCRAMASKWPAAPPTGAAWAVGIKASDLSPDDIIKGLCEVDFRSAISLRLPFNNNNNREDTDGTRPRLGKNAGHSRTP